MRPISIGRGRASKRPFQLAISCEIAVHYRHRSTELLRNLHAGADYIIRAYISFLAQRVIYRTAHSR